MARRKDVNWDIEERPTTEQACLAVLMDIRDELKQLNRHATSGRYETRRAEDAIRRIDKRLQKRIKLK